MFSWCGAAFLGVLGGFRVVLVRSGFFGEAQGRQDLKHNFVFLTGSSFLLCFGVFVWIW